MERHELPPMFAFMGADVARAIIDAKNNPVDEDGPEVPFLYSTKGPFVAIVGNMPDKRPCLCDCTKHQAAVSIKLHSSEEIYVQTDGGTPLSEHKGPLKNNTELAVKRPVPLSEVVEVVFLPPQPVPAL
jgi:hypothetical protein